MCSTERSVREGGNWEMRALRACPKIREVAVFGMLIISCLKFPNSR